MLHTREHGYHRLRGQAFRNADVRNYIPAVRRLIDLGYAWSASATGKMTSIRRECPASSSCRGSTGYDPILDPVLPRTLPVHDQLPVRARAHWPARWASRTWS